MALPSHSSSLIFLASLWNTADAAMAVLVFKSEVERFESSFFSDFFVQQITVTLGF